MAGRAVLALLPALGLVACVTSQNDPQGSELEGPGRFCGYSPIIDLLPGERVVTRDGGIHGGRFRWEGPFGRLEVSGIGLAGRPTGTVADRATSKGHALFEERRDGRGFVVAIWNRRSGAAYFSSPRPLTTTQLAAIDRVDLFEEGEDPQGCKLRTVFSWQ